MATAFLKDKGTLQDKPLRSEPHHQSQKKNPRVALHIRRRWLHPLGLAGSDPMLVQHP